MARLLRVVLGTLTLLVGVPVLLAATAAPATACDCATLRLEKLAPKADLVFVATMERSITEGAATTVSAPARVSRVYAGDVPATVRIETVGQGSACGLTRLRAGQSWLFLGAPVGGDAGVVRVGQCGGSVRADEAGVDVVEAALGKGREPRALTDETPAPAPEAAEPESDGSVPVWRGVLVGLAVLGGIGGLALTALRREPDLPEF